jgi:hypothetical protein
MAMYLYPINTINHLAEDSPYDKGMNTKARDVGAAEACLGSGP